ncbi:MAG TPA: S41 family peptidase [Alphaproteobacteria bacterium]|jgi:carboxyl-terminal processing protease|nr:S41 family peptidase [Alphaproteobacteria bacterium]
MNKVLGAVIATTLVVGPLSYEAAVSKPSDTYKQLDLYADVFEIVRNQYFKPVPDDKLVEASINGMVSSLDPHSSYMNPKDYADLSSQTKGEFGGLGLEVTQENGIVKVESPIDDTPAFKANIKSGDLITHIDGEPIVGVPLNDAVEKMRGAPGTQIKLTLRHNEKGDPFEVTLTREVIKVPSVKSRVESDNVGYIRISSFSEQTQPGLDKAITDLKGQLGNKLSGYVIDLRNNPGGLLNSAISVSNTFLDSGEIVSTRGRNPDDVDHMDAKPGLDKTKGIPVVVLINGGTASAAEIVSGALQDHHRAIIMGTQSFGKGSVQTILPLKNEGGLRLTTAEYFTPSGRSIQAKGITPDIEVHQSKIEELEQAGRLHEADLKGALPNPNDPSKPNVPAAGGPGQPSSSATPGPQAKGDKDKADKDKSDKSETAAEATTQPSGKPIDYQLARAVDLLHGVAMFNSRAVN